MIIAKQQVNHKMIEVARIARGFSQAELAEKINIEQGTLSKIESGLIKPKEEIINKISEALSYPPSFFEEEINVLSPLVTHYRKRKSINNNKLDLIEYNLFIRKHFIKKLLRSADIPNKLLYLSPEDHDPETIARITRQKWNIPRGPIKNLINLLETKGIIILQIEHNDEKLDGELMPDEHNLKVIYLNKNLTGDRQRFTLAHELGHLIMHQGDYIPTIDDAEKEANSFASEFLMPTEDIRYQLSESISFQQLGDLKRYWKVSMASLVRRARDLGIIDESRYKSLNVQLSRAGFKKKEPEFDVFPERPSIIYQLLTLHLNTLNYSLEELSNLLCIRANELKSMIEFYSNSLRVVK